MHIETGNDTAFNHYPNGYMWTGSGDRSVTKVVTFKHVTGTKPHVQVALSGVDVGNSHNARVTLSVTNISNDSFVAQVGTWGDTNLASINFTWLAIWA